MERLMHYFERVVLQVAQVLLMLVIVVAILELWYLFGLAIRDRVQHIDTIPALMLGVQRAFSRAYCSSSSASSCWRRCASISRTTACGSNSSSWSP